MIWSYNVMPIRTILILILVDSRQDKARQDKARQNKARQGKARWNIHRFVAYNRSDNDNDNDNHYSMNSHGMKIIS